MKSRPFDTLLHVSLIACCIFNTTAESYFQGTQQLASPHKQPVTTSSESVSASRLVPWRKEGFSPSLQLSDSRNESTTSSEVTNVPEVKKRLDLLRPAKAVFAKYKKRTNTKDWFSFKKRHTRLNHNSGETTPNFCKNGVTTIFQIAIWTIWALLV